MIYTDLAVIAAGSRTHRRGGRRSVGAPGRSMTTMPRPPATSQSESDGLVDRRGLIRRMWPYLRQVAGLLAVGSVAGIVMNTAVVLPAVLLGRAIDTALAVDRGQASAADLARAGLLVVAGTLCTEVPRVGKRWWLGVARARIRATVRADASARRARLAGRPAAPHRGRGRDRPDHRRCRGARHRHRGDHRRDVGHAAVLRFAGGDDVPVRRPPGRVGAAAGAGRATAGEGVRPVGDPPDAGRAAGERGADSLHLRASGRAADHPGVRPLRGGDRRARRGWPTRRPTPNCPPPGSNAGLQPVYATTDHRRRRRGGVDRREPGRRRCHERRGAGGVPDSCSSGSPPAPTGFRRWPTGSRPGAPPTAASPRCSHPPTVSSRRWSSWRAAEIPGQPAGLDHGPTPAPPHRPTCSSTGSTSAIPAPPTSRCGQSA